MAKNHDTFPAPQGEHRQADFDLAAYRAEGHVNSALLDELPPLLIAEMAKWCGEERCPTLVAFLKSAANEYPQQIRPGQNVQWSTGTTDPDVRAGQLSRCVSYAERDGRLSDVYGMAREMRQNYEVWRKIRRSDGKDNPGQGPSRIFRSLMPRAEGGGGSNILDATLGYAGSIEGLGGMIRDIQQGRELQEEYGRLSPIEVDEFQRQLEAEEIDATNLEALRQQAIDNSLAGLYAEVVLMAVEDYGLCKQDLENSGIRGFIKGLIRRASAAIEGISDLEQGVLLGRVDVDTWIDAMAEELPVGASAQEERR